MTTELRRLRVLCGCYIPKKHFASRNATKNAMKYFGFPQSSYSKPTCNWNHTIQNKILLIMRSLRLCLRASVANGQSFHAIWPFPMLFPKHNGRPLIAPVPFRFGLTFQWIWAVPKIVEAMAIRNQLDVYLPNRSKWQWLKMKCMKKSDRFGAFWNISFIQVQWKAFCME